MFQVRKTDMTAMIPPQMFFFVSAILHYLGPAGICSSVIPYVCDQFAMARLPRATFALLLSLLPASAAVIGIVVLRQIPYW